MGRFERIMRPLSISWICFLFVFIFSLVLSPFYHGGDQSYYQYVYGNMPTDDMGAAFKFYKKWLNSREFTHFITVFLFKDWVSKTLLMSLANGLLALFLAKLLNHLKAHPLIIFWIVCFGFYPVVLYFAAERLKFAFLFFAIFAEHSLSRSQLDVRSFIYATLSGLSHLQILGLFTAILPAWVMRQDWKDLRVQLTFLILILVWGLCLYLLWGQIEDKIGAKLQIDHFRPTHLVPSLLLMAASLYCAKNKVDVIASFPVIFVLIILFGPTRLNMFSYCLFIFFCVQNSQGFNWLIVSMQLYMTYKMVVFVSNFVDYGNGFLLFKLGT